ncbi:MAG: zinc-dependent metalloprotease [Solirubrobacterales bacterium]|nr:zinc-dependent metalloprotease [Solirubrobacterales bacterium]
MIDWVLAERIARYVASAGGSPASPPETDLSRLAAEAERRVVAYTGLAPQRPLPPPEGVDRREWARTNVEAMRRLMEPVLESAGDGLTALRPAVQLAVGVVVTIEVGVLLGYLSQRVLGQYELVLLDETHEHPPRLLFVMPNLGAAVRSLQSPGDEFMTWVALHEVTHAVQFAAVPWLQSHLGGLVRELLRSAELRIETPRRLRVPAAAEIKRVAAAVRQGDLIAVFTNASERDTLDRVQATMAVIEGHAEHVMDAVAPDLLPSLPRLRSALDRRRRSQTGLSRLLAKLLGLDLKLRQYEQGKFFCDAIVRDAGPDALHHVFSKPEALPTLAELRRPADWLVRVGLATQLAR